ncbi:MAG: hypothetical protein RL701_4914 [Pseudomonadota bacterium]|jgi:hypothetical protein
MLRNLHCIACVLFVVLCSPRLQAQTATRLTTTDKATADALFDTARHLMVDGEYAQACAKFEASQALDPSAGTLLNLADCYEKAGRTASAWARFRETASAARKTGSLDRERIARDRMRNLEGRLSYLTINAWKGQTLAISRDGVQVDPAVVGTAIPVDPGTHEIVASAPGKRSFHTQVEVGDNADRLSVTVPILNDETPPSEARFTSANEPNSQSASANLEERAGAANGGAQRAVALVTAAVGVAGIATGTVFGLKAASTWSDAKAHCNPYPYCADSGASLSREAQQSGTISTLGFVAGGVGLATFALLWLTAPSEPVDETPLSFALSPLAVTVSGRM